MKCRLYPILLATGAMSLPASATVTLPGVISSHMVLQRDKPIPIWGTANPNEKVTVTFRGQSKSTTASANGEWSLKLDPVKAGGPDSLTVTGENTITLEDVLVGEVWIGAGQSNMAGPVSQYTAQDPVLAAAAEKKYPTVRFANAGWKEWRAANPSNNRNFSAQLFAFGVKLQQELNCPVGLMLGAVGGTPSGFWISRKAFDEDAAIQKSIADYKPDYDLAWKKAEEAQAEWLKKPEAAEPNAKSPVKFPLKPGEGTAPLGHLYERRIRPFVPFGIKGVLWDQGESGTGVGGVDQYLTMGALIRGWRQDFGQGDFPFLYVQKPSGGGTAYDLNNPVTNQASKFSGLPKDVFVVNEMRATFLRLKDYPNTAMVTSTDLGPNTHPINKSGYGSRAADVALGFVYGQPREYYGPVLKSHKIQDGKIILSFNHLGKGLATPEGQPLQGFIIASEDKVWRWADAVIEGDTVVVSSPEVPKPAATRYAWTYGMSHANLFNKDGLPAQPFRTDDWDLKAKK